MKISYLELEGKKYPLTFSLKTTQLITEKYKDMNAFAKLLDDPKVNLSKKLDVVADILESMMQSGCQFCNAFSYSPYPDAPFEDGKFISLSAEQIKLCIPLEEDIVKNIINAIKGCIATSNTKELGTQTKKSSKKKKNKR